MDRFWSKVEVLGPDDCWLWKAALYGKTGYGAFFYQGNAKPAHQVAVLLSGRELAECTRHLCESRYATGDITYRRCVNPAHLEPGTYSENLLDALASGRTKPISPRDWHLTDEQVEECRKLKADGLSYAKIVERLCLPVSRELVRRNLRDRT